MRGIEQPYSNAADRAACRQSLRGGSRSFYAASLLLPRCMREPATALYGFCRMADDAVDLAANRQTALGGVASRLQAIYASQPHAHPADRAFAACVRAHAIPLHVPAALLQGFEWDVQTRRYETMADLTAYAVRVAGSVGIMMALIMGVRDRRLLARACDLGTAMQLTNIARDVGEDASMGRVYLPLAWLRDAGIDPEEWLRAPRGGSALSSVVERVLLAADELYERARPGLDRLPAGCRAAMRAAHYLYAEIGQEVRRRGYDCVTQRAVVHWRRKAALLAGAIIEAPKNEPLACSALAEAEFLLQPFAVSDAQAPLRTSRADRVAWLVELFSRLEREERARDNLAQLA